jgi:CheY-like chemotaxis protein
MDRDKLLIIDDDPRNIFALSAVLRSKGYKCITASSAQDGIDMLTDRNDIGIILIDMMMPDMDGYAAIPIIRGMEKLSTMPIVAVTAQAMAGDKERCLKAGADDYLSKPIDVYALMVVLGKYKNGTSGKVY